LEKLFAMDPSPMNLLLILYWMVKMVLEAILARILMRILMPGC